MGAVGHTRFKLKSYYRERLFAAVSFPTRPAICSQLRSRLWWPTTLNSCISFYIVTFFLTLSELAGSYIHTGINV